MRTLALVKPQGWESTLKKGLENIREKRTTDGRWRVFPFYYTLLTLSELDAPSAKAELRHASIAAKRLIGRYRGHERTPRFRRIGLKAALDA